MENVPDGSRNWRYLVESIRGNGVDLLRVNSTEFWNLEDDI